LILAGLAFRENFREIKGYSGIKKYSGAALVLCIHIHTKREPWFVLKDVRAVLEIANTTDTAKRLDEDKKATLDSIECLCKDTIFINERGAILRTAHTKNCTIPCSSI
jgi:hypothetical protein